MTYVDEQVCWHCGKGPREIVDGQCTNCGGYIDV